MKQKLLKNRLLVLICIALIGVAVVFWLWHTYHKKPAYTPVAAGQISTSHKNQSSNINYGPPTTEEKQEAQDHKAQLAQPPPPPVVGTKKVTPVIVSATTTQVRAYVQGVFEDGGTCTATATKGTEKVIAKSTGVATSNYTQCEPMNWSTPLAGSGWTVVVDYASTTASGESQPQTIN